MSRELTCVLREEENRWIGRIYESRPEGGAVEYTYEVIAPLRFQQGHVVAAALDTTARKAYSNLDEAQSAMRSALHQMAVSETS
ncbi:MAG TPA: hypothetical protein VGE04_18300 [Chloroflexia bacterium]|jgi:hypothetical protein